MVSDSVRQRGHTRTGPGIVWFGAAGLANALGTGIYYPFQLLFFREVMGISLTTVGIGLTAAILCTLPTVLYIGRWVDRAGPRPVLIVASLARAAAFAGFVAGGGVVVFVALSMLVSLGFRADQVGTQVLAAAAAPKGRSGQWLAVTRIVFNAGVGLGAVLTGLALTGRPAVYPVLGLATAAAFLLAALCYLPLRVHTGGTERTESVRSKPWRHGLYLRLAGVQFVMFTALVATEAALPVYLVDHLGQPAWQVSLILAVNIVVLVVLQLPVSKLVQRHRPLRMLAFGAVLHGTLFLAFAVAAVLPGSARLVVFLLGTVVYTVGEVVSSQVLMVLLVHVPPAAERGAYQAFSQTMTGVALGVSPLFVTVLFALAPPAVWWTLLGAVLAVGCGVAARRAEPPAITTAWAAQKS
jgi:MFS family permease